jgi:hypothetical protein
LKNISLIVSEWHDEMSSNLLSHIDNSNHPFHEILVLVPRDVSKKALHSLNTIRTEVSVNIRKRRQGNGDFDFCHTDVSTDWFMITNSYHRVAKNVDLLFNDAGQPVISAVDANNDNCFSVPGCRDVAEKSRELFNETETKLVRDHDMIFHTDTVKKFCILWTGAIAKEVGVKKISHLSSMGVIASAYTSYLRSISQLDKLYELSAIPGYRYFNRFVDKEEEKAASNFGGTVTANRLLRSNEIDKSTINHFEDHTDIEKKNSQLQKSPIFPQLQRAPTFPHIRRSPPIASPLVSDAQTRNINNTTATPSMSDSPSVSLRPSDSPSISSATSNPTSLNTAKPSITSFPSSLSKPTTEKGSPGIPVVILGEGGGTVTSSVAKAMNSTFAITAFVAVFFWLQI